MKLLFICKRRPQGRDLFARPYGRFYYLPKILAEKGHEVHLLLCGYKKEPRIRCMKDDIHWQSVSLIPSGPFSFIREAEKVVRQIMPEWVTGFSDTYYGILAQRLGEKYHISSLIDAYDNFESYLPWMKPLHAVWRKSLSGATLVTAAGPGLAALLRESRPGKPTEVVPMAADPLFQPLARIECRKKLGLPADRKLIGYCGSTIHSNRGINLLFEAFTSLQKELPDLGLVMTGRQGRGVSLPPEANWLGYIADADMPILLNSLDMLVVMNRPTAFGNHSYPVKLYEAMRCRVPVVASETLATKWILQNHRELLVEPCHVEKLTDAIKKNLEIVRLDYGAQKGWDLIGEELEKLLFRYSPLSAK